MNKKIIIKGLIAIVAIILQTHIAFSQWNVGNAGGFNYGRTNSGVNPIGIGIGSFPNGTPPLSALHINTNPPFPTNTFFTSGEVFRTTGPAANINAWRLLTGPGNGIERFNINVPANSNNVNITTMQSGFMAFGTAGIERMRITAGGDVGIGLPNPNNTLQVRDLINFEPNTNSTFIGYLAGNSTSSGAGNNFIGYQAGNSNSTGWSNSFFGYQAGFSNSAGGGNNFFGNRAGYTNSTGGANNFFGHLAGFSNSTGGGNNFFGYRAGFSNSTGMQNNFFGNLAGLSNSTGGENNFFGDRAGYTNSTGGGNNFFGYRAGYTNSTGLNNSFFGNRTGFSNISGHSNSFFGNYVGPNNINGSENTFIGSESGFSNTTGNRNLLIGRLADISDGLTNATAIGYRAYVSASNCMVLGAIPGVNGYIGLPAVKVGIGTTAPANILEIAATCTTGTSGLRLSVLAGTSPVNVNVNGVLSVNPLNGDVILVSGGSGGGFGAACTPPAIPFNLADNWRVGLGNYNLYFAGPSLGMPSLPNTNSVGIGWDCSVLSAKLDVLQNSLNPNTIGISVINRDPSSGIWGAPIPVIGLKSLMPLTSANSHSSYKIAGWFEVESNPASTPGYAVYVPHNGGSVDIGYSFSSATPSYLLDVNGSINTPTWTSPSDSILKNNVAPLLYGIDVLRNINVVSYSYNGKGGYNTTDKYVGIIAEQLANIAPYAIDTSFILLDSTDTQLTPVLNVDQGALMYTAINAIKEMDSIITSYIPGLLPQPPVLALPADGATGVELKPLLLSWYKSLNAERYTVEVALDNSFEKIVIIAEAFDTVLFTGVEKHNTTYFLGLTPQKSIFLKT